MLASALHPFDPAVARAFVAALDPSASATLPGLDPAWSADLVRTARAAAERLAAGDARGAYDLTAAWALALAAFHPVFMHDSLTLTTWEARVERGAAMLLRPPSRLFIEAGFDPVVGRRLPIRLETTGASMGGAWVPPHLVPNLGALLDTRFDRIAQRLAESDLEPLGVIAMSRAAIDYALQRGLGLYESEGVILADEPATLPPGGAIRTYDRKRVDPALRDRVALATTPAKRPGLLDRLTRRTSPDTPSPNGHHRD